MKNSKTLFHEVVGDIHLSESTDEIGSIAFFLLTGLFAITKTDVLAGKMVPFSESTAQVLQKAVKRVNQGEPVQYVLGEAWFFGRKFHVNGSVLIPRPETEGLVAAVLAYCARLPKGKENGEQLSVLDIGTGSGCIPVTLSKALSAVRLYATDVSNAALSVAVGNAAAYDADITFIEHNILTENIPVAELDVIVSNPPYVTLGEKSAMHRNVLDYEPHGALFVPDDDALVFYRSIARQSKQALKVNGFLALEVNPLYSKAVADLIRDNGFKSVEILRDISGKERIVTGIKA